MAESVYSPARASFYFRRQVFSLDHDRSCDHLVCWSWKWSVTERPLIDLPIASVKGRPEWGDLPMSIDQILRGTGPQRRSTRSRLTWRISLDFGLW